MPNTIPFGKFQGTWKDQQDQTIEVGESMGILVVKYTSNGRGPFDGCSIYVKTGFISVNFTDDQPQGDGVLSEDNNTIYWSNGTQWYRQ
ncbi:MAG TPA: hypothetical protein DCE41_19710 [Cytophagales bacterium]|nr:hypothetical protein [Cytophagales bacterium]HAA19283.1 hypothetical protein [Cytophagales bacterium]HAP61673.1 hypothetical protein [Cytophagales bacterium]